MVSESVSSRPALAATGGTSSALAFRPKTRAPRHGMSSPLALGDAAAEVVPPVLVGSVVALCPGSVVLVGSGSPVLVGSVVGVCDGDGDALGEDDASPPRPSRLPTPSMMPCTPSTILLPDSDLLGEALGDVVVVPVVVFVVDPAVSFFADAAEEPDAEEPDAAEPAAALSAAAVLVEALAEAERDGRPAGQSSALAGARLPTASMPAVSPMTISATVRALGFLESRDRRGPLLG